MYTPNDFPGWCWCRRLNHVIVFYDLCQSHSVKRAKRWCWILLQELETVLGSALEILVAWEEVHLHEYLLLYNSHRHDSILCNIPKHVCTQILSKRNNLWQLLCYPNLDRRPTISTLKFNPCPLPKHNPRRKHYEQISNHHGCQESNQYVVFRCRLLMLVYTIIVTVNFLLIKSTCMIVCAIWEGLRVNSE